MLSIDRAVEDSDAALHALFEANRLLRDAGEKIASAAGQTHARRMVLQEAGDGATVPDIARVLGLQRQGVQRIADELVADGLGRYVDNPRHKRSKLFVVTDLGDAARLGRSGGRGGGGLGDRRCGGRRGRVLLHAEDRRVASRWRTERAVAD